MKISRIEEWMTPRLVIQLGIVLTLLVFSFGYFISWREYHKQFVIDASKRAEDVVEMLQDRVQEMDGLARFMEGMGRRGEVDRDSFREFIPPILSHSGIQAVAWAPLVPASRREEMERAAGFPFTQRASDDSLAPAMARRRYYPLTFVESLSGNLRLLGYDLGSDPVLEAVLREAEETGEIEVTTRVRLIRELGGGYGFVVCAPVYDAAHKILGFAVELFRANDILEAALRPTAGMALNTTLKDRAAPPGGEPLFHHVVPREIAEQFMGVDDLIFPQLSFARDFTLAGHQWRVGCEGTRGYHSDAISLAFLLILPTGFFITRLSSLYLREHRRSREEVDLLVERRTAELATSNGRLLDEIKGHRQTEQVLALTRNHLQTMLDNLPMEAWLKDRDGKFLMVNHQYASAVGRLREEILGLTVFDLWPPAQAEYYHSVDEEILATGVSRQVDEHRADGEGGVAWYEIFKAPIIAPDGTILGTTGTAWDITPRKQSEEQIMMQQYKLENLNLHLTELVQEEISKNRAKDLLLMSQEKLASVGQLAAGVAHEINTPLAFATSNIRVFAEYFQKLRTFLGAQQELLAPTAPPEQLRELAVTEQRLDISFILDDAPELIAESLSGVERVSRIVMDLKSFSRVDAPVYEPADLTACLENSLSILAHELKDQAVIHREYQPLPLIPCNPGEMNQLFLHLLRNAGQALAPPGRITLKSRYDDGFVYLAVEDTGHGIPEELNSRIFEPFFTTRDVGQGVGLGLSVCRDIVGKHHGQLRVESVVGVGTTVTVKLPRRDKPSWCSLEAGDEDATPLRVSDNL